MGDTNTAENIMLRMSYAETRKACTLSRTFASVCRNPNFWVRKAQAVYDTDLSFAPPDLSESDKYKWLEAVESVSPHSHHGGKLFYNDPYWIWRLKRDFNITQEDWDDIHATDIVTHDQVYRGTISPPAMVYEWLASIDGLMDIGGKVLGDSIGIAMTQSLLLTYGANDWDKPWKKRIYSESTWKMNDSLYSMLTGRYFEEKALDAMFYEDSAEVLKYLWAYNRAGVYGARYASMAFDLMSADDALEFMDSLWGIIIDSPYRERIEPKFFKKLNSIKVWRWFIRSFPNMMDDTIRHKLDRRDPHAHELYAYLNEQLVEQPEDTESSEL